MAARLPVCPFCGTREVAPPPAVVPRTGTQPAGAMPPPPPDFDEPSAARGGFIAPIERTADQAPLVPRAGGTPRTEAFNRVDVDAASDWPPKPGAPRATLPAGSPEARFAAMGRTGVADRPLVGTTAPPEGKSEDGHWPPVGRPSPRVLANPALAAGPKVDRSRLIWALLVLLAGVGVATFFALRPQTFPTDLLADGPSARPCEGRAHCVVALLAPWDPASGRSLGTVSRLQTLLTDTDVGLAVVVANDDPEARAAFAAQIAAPTWFETGDLLTQRLDVQQSPTWFVLDARGRITRTVAGTYFPLAAHLSALGMKADHDLPPPTAADEAP